MMLSVPSKSACLSAPPSPYRMGVQANINNAPPAVPNTSLATRKLAQLSISVPTVEVVNENVPLSPTLALAAPASPGAYPNGLFRMNSFRRSQSVNTTPVIPSGLTASSSSSSSSSLSAPVAPLRSVSEPPPETKKSRRVKLGPGYSMICWAKKTRAMPKVNKEDVIITHEELSRHCTEDDAWMAVHDRVYNVTPYIKFHPGGVSELLKGAGQDATILFDEVHRSVNVKNMLAKLFVGKLERGGIRARTGSLSSIRLPSNSLTVAKPTIVLDGMNRHALARRDSEPSDEASQHTPMSPIKPPLQFAEETDSLAVVVDPPSPIRKNSDASRPTIPSYNWEDKGEFVVVNIDIQRNKAISDENVVLDIHERKFEAAVFFDNWVYELGLTLSHSVTESQVTIVHTKVEIRLRKEDASLKWEALNTAKSCHDQTVSRQSRDVKFRSCTITSITTVNHDTKIFNLRLPGASHLAIPIGHHVVLKAKGNADLERSYTPVQPLIPSDDVEMNSQTLQFMIKLYKDGKMSNHLAELREGEKILVSDPQGTFEAQRLVPVTDCVLIAAGSGFTPMMRLITNLLFFHSELSSSRTNLLHRTENSGCKVKLLFANKREEDILLRNELDKLAKEHDCFSVEYVLSDADNSWDGLRGRITPELLSTFLPPCPKDAKDHSSLLFTVCGPQPFTMGVGLHLHDTYPEKCIHIFE